MSDIPHYRDQAATFDPKVEIPDGAPLAQGHDSDQAAEVADASAAHAENVEAENQAVADALAAGEPAPGAPGDPQAEPKAEPKAKKTEPKKES